MDLSIIMPVQVITEELFKLTETSLESLKDVDAERIIIDNNSTTVQMPQIYWYADIVVKNKINLGYPKAVNQGIELANSEYLAIANNDIVVSPNWWEVAKDIFDSYPEVATVHFRMLDYGDDLSFGTDTWLTGKERWCTSSFFVIKKEVLDEIGLYDENYIMGGYDDWDLHHRLRHLHNWKSAYTNKACYRHKHSSTQNLRDPEERKRSDTENREYFKKKFDEYPEEIWQQIYPKQMSQPYIPFP